MDNVIAPTAFFFLRYFTNSRLFDFSCKFYFSFLKNVIIIFATLNGIWDLKSLIRIEPVLPVGAETLNSGPPGKSPT